MKTVIGGASIIDIMILVVDCQKLIQTQTAECIVLGEILMNKLIVAFNKIDLLKADPPKLQAQLTKLKQ
jgi:selenocysteine-specific elongation factor